MQLSTRQWLILAGGTLAGGLVAFWWLNRDEPGALVDQLGDAVVTLTSSDESRLEELEPMTQDQVRALIANLAGQGIGVHVGQTLRTSAQEKDAIAAGHTSAALVTSWHQLGRAVDLYPLDDNGKPDLTGSNLDAIRAIASTAEGMGFRQLAFNADGSKRIIQGTKGPIWDSGHIEWRSPYGSIAEAVAAEGANYGIG